MKCVVSVSGGAASAVALERVLAKYPDATAVFADTQIEDEDLYRFLSDIERHFGIEIVRLADGRDPWQVFLDEKMIGNTRADICSRILKRELIAKWVAENCSSTDTVLAFGMNADEFQRHAGLAKRWHPFQVWNPLMDDPRLSKCEILDHIIDDWDIDPPRLYDLGFHHNNCGGGCVKAGQGAWAHLYKKLPERYAWWEEQEQKAREHIGKDVSILRDRRGGTTKAMTLREFRQRIESGDYNPTDWGFSCDCMGNEGPVQQTLFEEIGCDV